LYVFACPAPRSTAEHRTTFLAVSIAHVDVVVFSRVNWKGGAAVTTMLVAVTDPSLRTVTVYVAVPSAATEAGPVCETTRRSLAGAEEAAAEEEERVANCTTTGVSRSVVVPSPSCP
jgi:hypothetical protein